MMNWYEFPLLKSFGGERESAAANHDYAQDVLRAEALAADILEYDPDLTVDDISADDPDVGDSDLLAAVLAQTAHMSSERPAKQAAPRQPLGWVLPGFEGKCRVATSFGDLPIEALRRRDMVRTISGAYREVKWIDAIRLDVDFMARHPEASPVMIRAKALGGTYPVKNMLVSPGQDVWVPKVSDGFKAMTAAKLDGQPNIQRMPKPDITYYRFHCGEPEKVCIEGSWFCVGPEPMVG